MYCEESNLRMHFKLNGTFSSFNTRKPADSELELCDNLFITPDSASWDPYSENFATNEAAMIDSSGDIIDTTHRKNSLSPQLMDPYYSLPSVNAVEGTIDNIIANGMDNYDIPCPHLTFLENRSIPNYDAHNFSDELLNNTLMGKINATLGKLDEDTVNHASPSFTTTLDSLEYEFQSEISTLEVSNTTGATPYFMKNIWSISDKEAQAVANTNTQLNRQPNDGLLSRQFSTNDQMPRYRRINSYFFSDTLCVTKPANSLQGYLYLQVFVSDKGYVAVYPMELKSDSKDALHSFCKGVGVPIALVVDPSGEQTSKVVRKFCNQVGTTLRILEESTQWANRAELYIGLLKKAIRKDLASKNSPMVLWNYCVQR